MPWSSRRASSIVWLLAIGDVGSGHVPTFPAAVEERSYAEVASQLRIPISTVMSRKYQGRQMVLAYLAEAPP